MCFDLANQPGFDELHSISNSTGDFVCYHFLLLLSIPFLLFASEWNAECYLLLFCDPNIVVIPIQYTRFNCRLEFSMLISLNLTSKSQDENC